MEVVIMPDAESAAGVVAGVIAGVLATRPAPVLGLATGRSPPASRTTSPSSGTPSSASDRCGPPAGCVSC